MNRWWEPIFAVVCVALFFWLPSVEWECPFRGSFDKPGINEKQCESLIRRNKKLEAERDLLTQELRKARAYADELQTLRSSQRSAVNARPAESANEDRFDREFQRKLNDGSLKLKKEPQETSDPGRCRVPRIKVPADFPYQD